MIFPRLSFLAGDSDRSIAVFLHPRKRFQLDLIAHSSLSRQVSYLLPPVPIWRLSPWPASLQKRRKSSQNLLQAPSLFSLYPGAAIGVHFSAVVLLYGAANVCSFERQLSRQLPLERVVLGIQLHSPLAQTTVREVS